MVWLQRECSWPLGYTEWPAYSLHGRVSYTQGMKCNQLRILEQAAGHLRWKVNDPPSQSVGSRFEPHWRLTTG